MNNPQDTYTRIAKYEKYHMDMSQVYYAKIIRDITAVFKNGLVLDIGCFDGSLGYALIKSGFKVCGIEANHNAGEIAKQRGVDVTNADIEKGLPYPDDHFDCVIAAEIIEHLYDTDKFLQDIKRVLKPGGILEITIPNISCFTNRLKMLLGHYPRFCEYQAGTAGGHIRVYNLNALREQLKLWGFSIIKASGANFPLPMQKRWIPSFIKKIAAKIGDFTPGIAGQIIICAENIKQK